MKICPHRWSRSISNGCRWSEGVQ